MKILVLCLILLSSVWGARVVESYWLEGQVFSRYLEERDIPAGLLQRIDEEDKKFLLEIQSGEKFYELFDEVGRLLQAFIPIGEEMQIQVVREADSGSYSFDIVPIAFADHEHKVVIPIQSNPHSDIMQATNNIRLADKIDRFFKHTIDCRKLQKNDTLAIIYTQKERLGKPLGSPKVKIAMMETGKKKQFIYADKSGAPCTNSTKKVTYDSHGNPVTKAEIRRLKRKLIFGMPLRHIRISSRFSYKRWHPILHRYRPHLGVDFAARRGTPLLAVNDGTVIFAGRKGGYGNVVKIRHRGGYVSLYAHQSRIRAKKGQKVKKGQVVGYVGSTGRSTGPHLHFGLYRHNRAIDPLRVLKKKSSGLKSFVTKTIRIKGAKRNKAKVIKMLKHPGENYRWGKGKSFCLSEEKRDDNGKKGLTDER